MDRSENGAGRSTGRNHDWHLEFLCLRDPDCGTNYENLGPAHLVRKPKKSESTVFHRAHSHAIVPAVLGLLMSGCSKTSEKTSPTSETVTGVVSLDGQPLTVGLVNFHPVDGGMAAYAEIAKDGTYRLSVPAGEYLITVSATEAPMADAGPGRGPGHPRPGKRLTPEKYAKKETTDLRATVTGGNNSVPLLLKSEEKVGPRSEP